MVVDASVLAKLFSAEDLSANARQAIAEAVDVWVPAHALAELAEVLSRKALLNELTWEQCELAADAAVNLVQVAPLDGLLVPALQITKEIGCAVYDSLYVALAQQRADVLTSWDQRLLRRVAGTPYGGFVRSLESVR